MPRRIIQRKGKIRLVRDVEKRDAQAISDSQLEGSAKRPRGNNETHDDDDDDHAMFDIRYDHFDSDGDNDDPPEEANVQTSVTDFDESGLMEMLIQTADDDISILEPDAQGQLHPVDEEIPTTSELQELADYQLHGDGDNDNDDEAEGVVDEDDETSITEGRPTPSSTTLSFEQPRTPGSISTTSATLTGDQIDEDDIPEIDPFRATSTIVTRRRQDRHLNDFTIALGLYCIRNGVSRKQYMMIREILELLKSGDGLRKLDQLPDTVTTLKRHIREELPLLEVRSQPIVLNPEKLPASRLHYKTVANGGVSVDIPKQLLFFFNPINVFKTVLASKLSTLMHFGMAKLVDNPSEAYHSIQWAASIRTTSGEFAYYPSHVEDDNTTADNAHLDSRDPIFPGDFVEFKCAHRFCGTCYSEIQGVDGRTRSHHTGQVLAVYRDHRTESRRLGGHTVPSHLDVDECSEGDVVLAIARLWSGPKLLTMNERQTLQILTNPVEDRDFHPQELVIVLDPIEYISVDRHVLSRARDIEFDHSFMSDHKFDDDFRPRGDRFIRRAFNRSTRSFAPVGRVAPVPGLLEMKEFGREFLVNKFARGNCHGEVRSLSILTFADGFGLYRTMYKSVMGVYNEIAALPKREHSRQINVFPLTLGPHGSNFKDVIKTLEPMRCLDRGTTIRMNNSDVLLCAPILAFTGDMPQQQANAGMMGVSATRGCRSCDITSKKRGDLSYNIISNARGHFETLRQRRTLDGLKTKPEKARLCTELGISLEPPAVAHIAPALDVINTRPSDPAHSEFGGISKMIHQLLIDQAMKPQAVVEYCKILRKMPFPPGWAAIPSPYHVLTYTLQEHARWSVLMTILARCWLRDSHLRLAFVNATKIAFRDEINNGDFGGNPTTVDIIIAVMSATVHTNCLLGSDVMDVGDRKTFSDVVYRGRLLFQRLCEAAALVSNKTRAGQKDASPTPSMASRHSSLTPSEYSVDFGPSIAPSVEREVDDDINVGTLSGSQKAVKYRQWASRPNVHIGLYYKDVFHRYGITSLLMVLSGEMKHKQWKNIVTHTNHRNPERDLFEYENLIQTVRLLLIDGYKHEEPRITNMIQDLNRTVPTVFAGLIPQDGIDQADEEDLDDPSISVKIVGDDRHYEPSALVRIKANHCRDVLKLSIRTATMSNAFRTGLRNAYSMDYQKNVIASLGTPLKWWKKVSFTNREKGSTRRTVLHRGDYVAYRDQGQKARLDQFFVHETPVGSGNLYLFCLVTPVIELPGRKDHLTDLPIMKIRNTGRPLQELHDNVSDDYNNESSQEIIGLPAVSKTGLYMVPFTQRGKDWSLYMSTSNTDNGHDEESEDHLILFVDWRIQFV